MQGTKSVCLLFLIDIYRNSSVYNAFQVFFTDVTFSRILVTKTLKIVS
jgi:hypothetical protein